MSQLGFGNVTGQYLANWTTGVLAATLAADAPIASIRNGFPATLSLINPPPRAVYILEIGLQLSITAAFTAVQQFGLYISRFTSANMAGGATFNPFKISSSTLIDSVCKPGGAEAGDIRAATTAALTTAGTVIDAVKQPLFSWSAVGPADYPKVVLDFHNEPIQLKAGEGVALFNQVVWPAAGTAILGGYLKYEERAIL